MKDIVEAALNHQESFERADDSDTDEFGDPELALIGFGSTGQQIVQQGLDDRSPDPGALGVDTFHVHDSDELSTEARDTDYVILVGDGDDHQLLTDIGRKLGEEPTSIAIPIPVTEAPVETVATVSATIPCSNTHAQELATDLLRILAGEMQVSPPVGFYRDLRTVGRIHGCREKLDRDEFATSPKEFADELVAETLSNPLHTAVDDDSTHVFSILHAGGEVTLKEFDAVRNAIGNRIVTDGGAEYAAADTTAGMDSTDRLTVCTSPLRN